MKKVTLFLSLLCYFSIRAQYAPAAGQSGTTAVFKDSNIISSWATGCTVVRGYLNASNHSVAIAGNPYASFGTESNALGKAEGDQTTVVSLGDGGVATLSFDQAIKNETGPDFCVFENGVANFLELGFVEVSSDGSHFVRFPAYSETQTATQVSSFGLIDPTQIHNFAGKYLSSYGVPFDLEDLVDSIGIDLSHITHVRIVDVVGSIDAQYGTQDVLGRMVNDPFPTAFASGGFDLDAVGIIHPTPLGIKEQQVAALHVFPQPFGETLTLSGLPTAETIQLELYNASGQLVFSTETSSQGTLQLAPNIVQGLYFLTVSTHSTTTRLKVVKR